MRRSSPSAALNESFIEPRTIHEITIQLPLGVTLEEIDSSSSSNVAPSSGVAIIGIHENGNAAIYNSNIFSKLKPTPGNSNSNRNIRNDCICIRDKIMSINGVPCHDKSFDDVIFLLSNCRSSNESSMNHTITIGLGRLEKSTVVNYHNGIAISAKPGESYGFLAANCGIDTIEYKCRSGNCQTCVRLIEFPDKIIDDDNGTSVESSELKCHVYQRTIKHCVQKVPRGYEWLHVFQ